MPFDTHLTNNGGKVGGKRLPDPFKGSLDLLITDYWPTTLYKHKNPFSSLFYLSLFLLNQSLLSEGHDQSQICFHQPFLVSISVFF